MRRLLVLAAGALLATGPAAGAATIAVDTTSDAVAADGHCSLREAITAANSDNFPEPGPNECPKGDGADTITLGPGSFEFTRAGAADDLNATGDLDITGGTTITGAGPLLTTIDAHQLDRVLDVLSGGSLTLSGVTVTGGHAPDGTNGGSHTGGTGALGTGDDATAGESGGGIRSAGPLVLTDTIVTANQAGAGGNGGTGTGGDAGAGASGGRGEGGSAGNGGDGGGIWTTDDLTLSRVVISANHAGNGGTGGLGQGGMGGFTTSGTAGPGGNAHGGNGGFGGNGGGLMIGGTGVATIDSTTVHANTAGDAGTGGAGHGGLGGAAGLNPSTGGQGGAGTGGAGEQGGSGAGISVSRTLTLTRSLVEGNTAGHGGPGGAATGGNGGGSTNGSGGRGGDATGGSSVGGGATGGVDIPGGTISDTTITGNHSGSATIGGAATGGKGGGGSAAGGNGGNADAGFGGNGGYVGGIGANDATIVHVTITANTLGTGGAAATATGGTGGSPGGGSGSASPGLTGSVSLGSAIYPNGTSTLRNSIVADNDPHACVAGVTDGGHNVSFGDASCPGADVDPLLGPLADNGGPTLTFRPQSGSPVVDAVPAGGAGCTATDQRRAARPGGAGCDIGAYEIAPPALALGELGATVHGTVNPNARSTTYHFEYGATTAYGSSTAEGSLQAGVNPVAVSATLDGLAAGTTYHVRLVATNADGTNATADAMFNTASQDGGGTKDTTAPVILSASVKPKAFRRKRGTTFHYRLSETARVVFTIQRKKGRRYVKAMRFSKASKAGANTRKFRTRKLKPGRYRATLVATDAAGNRSKARRLTIRIKR